MVLLLSIFHSKCNVMWT